MIAKLKELGIPTILHDVQKICDLKKITIMQRFKIPNRNKTSPI